MNTLYKGALVQQFDAAIGMLENVMNACPQSLWEVRCWHDEEIPRAAEFWYLIYHTLFWLDLYLSGSVEGFVPPQPFTLEELDPAGIIPATPYTKKQLQRYLQHVREKCVTAISSLTQEDATQWCAFSWGKLQYFELQIDNIRHVQEHTAQLNLILGQKIGWNPKWISNGK